MVTDFKIKRNSVFDKVGIPFNPTLSIEDYLKEAKLDFTVLKAPLYAKVYNAEGGLLRNDPDARWKNMPLSYALLRDDNGLMFTSNGRAVTDMYSVFQNIEMFQFLTDLCDMGRIDFDTAGSFNGGSRVFTTIDLKDNIEIFPNDTINRHLLITNKHDGKGCIDIRFVNTRVVCQNTLELALRENTQHKWSLRHTINKDDRLDTIKHIIGDLKIQKREIEEKLMYYKQVEINDKQRLALLALSYFPASQYIQLKKHNFVLTEENLTVGAKTPVKTKKTLKEFNMLRETLETGVGQDLYKGTVLNVYNGITCYIQNVKEYKNNEEHFDNMFGNDILMNFENNMVENLVEIDTL